MEIPSLNISFPEIKLQTRDAHKLRGYFGNLFEEYSPLLHNHYQGGEFRYNYPLVQYKVIDQTPMLVGIGEGAQLLLELFLKIKEIKIDTQVYQVSNKHIQAQKHLLQVDDTLHTYHFQTLWMALNQKNYQQYAQTDSKQRTEQLKKIAIGNILSFYRGVDFYLKPEQKILIQVKVAEKNAQFKNQKMICFKGQFTSNALLPDYIGLGKSVSRGFGTILRET